jgi:zinc protease
LQSPAGIEIWHVEDDTVPVVSLEFAFLGGASQDPDGKPGLTNMMVSLLDEGAGDLTAQAFQEALEERAIELSFGAGRDRISGSMRSLSEHVSAAFDYLGLAVQSPRFDSDAVERVRAQIISGLKRDETDPQVMTRDALYRIAFDAHRYGRPVDGTIASVTGLTTQDIRQQHRKLLARDRLLVVAVGSIRSAELVAGVDRAFAALPATAPLDVLSEAQMKGAGRREILDLDIPQSTLYLALPGLGRRDPDFMPAFVVNHILGGGSFTSRLWTEVREKRGLAYSVWSGLRWSAHTALFMAGTATSNERVSESYRVMLEEFERMASGGPTDVELEKAKAYLTGSYALQFDTSRKIADHLLMLRADGLPIDYIDRRNADITEVTRDGARAVAAKLLGGVVPLTVATGRPQGLA